MPKPFKVIRRRLGRERAAGQAVFGDGLVEIDPRESPYEQLDTIIHESIHLLDPEMSEEQVDAWARKISITLWRQKYRRVDQ